MVIAWHSLRFGCVRIPFLNYKRLHFPSPCARGPRGETFVPQFWVYSPWASMAARSSVGGGGSLCGLGRTQLATTQGAIITIHRLWTFVASNALCRALGQGCQLADTHTHTHTHTRGILQRGATILTDIWRFLSFHRFSRKYRCIGGGLLHVFKNVQQKTVSERYRLGRGRRP